MSEQPVDPLAMFAKRNAEEKFKLGELKGAISFATMAKTLDPNVDGIDEALFAYRIHLAASRKSNKAQTRFKDLTYLWTDPNEGATKWRQVLGIEKGFDDIESIKNQCNELVEMVNPKKNASVATWGALRLIYKARSNLCDKSEQKVVLLNQQIHWSSSAHEGRRGKKRSNGIKVNKTTCPRCRKWCKFEVPKVSSAPKHGEKNLKTKPVLITCSGCRCKFDPISGKIHNS